MSDIFISYSRKDSEQALSLAERLQAQGMSVWIDQRGIEAAASWSKEIVHAIDECKAFMVLIFSSSMASANVSREVGIASEAQKKMLPIAIEDIRLSDELRYHLSGLQRVAYTQFDAITQALVGFGIVSTLVTKLADARKTLMILPFEDLSPTRDNEWFADGLVSEMIGKLSAIKSLKLIDRQTSLQIKRKGHSIADLAQILEVRYFIEGSIRKFGEQIKIDAALLDFETGDYLWQDTHKGVFADIFDIQEAIADKVVAGLKLHLGSKEKNEISKKLTVNAEAYQFYLKGREHNNKQTRAGFELAIALHAEATRLDPLFARAFGSLASSQISLYRLYDRRESHLAEAEMAIAEIEQIEGKSVLWCWTMSTLACKKREYAQAEHYARLGIEQDPEYALAYEALGVALAAQNRLLEAAEAQAKSAYIRSDKSSYLSLLIRLSELGDANALQSKAKDALPVFEKHLKLNPDDSHSSVSYANVLRYAGKTEEARTFAERLAENPTLDGFALYNLGCLFCTLGEINPALDTLHRSIERGYSDIEGFRRDVDLIPLRDLPKFQALLEEVEVKIAAQNA